MIDWCFTAMYQKLFYISFLKGEKWARNDDLTHHKESLSIIVTTANIMTISQGIWYNTGYT